jgi:hypothetical protein
MLTDLFDCTTDIRCVSNALCVLIRFLHTNTLRALFLHSDSKAEVISILVKENDVLVFVMNVHACYVEPRMTEK